MSTTTTQTPTLTPRTAEVQKKMPDREFIERRIKAAQQVRDVRPAKSGMYPKGSIVTTKDGQYSVEAFRWKLLGHIDIIGHGVCLVTQDRKTQRRAALMIDPVLNKASKAHWQEVTPDKPVEQHTYTNEELATAVVRYHRLLQYDAQNLEFEGEYDYEQQAKALRSELLIEWGVDPTQYAVDFAGYDQATLDAEDAADAGGEWQEPSPAAFVHLAEVKEAA